MSELKALDELRKLSRSSSIASNVGKAIRSIADAIEAEIAERYMELPVDAGGEVIKPGDTLEYVDVKNHETIIGTVERICLDSGEVTIRFGNRPSAVFARESWKFLHVKPRTIEDVLRDAMEKVAEHDMANGTLDEMALRYADEIRKLMGGGE